LSTIPGLLPEIRVNLRRIASEILCGAGCRNLLDARDGVAGIEGIMESAAAGPVYQFEGFVLDLTRGILSNVKGEELPLRRKSFDLLRLLIVNRGRLLDRDTIGQAIWSDVTVTDDSITQCVKDIRRALGDREQRILKTMRRRGYIFDANIAAQEKPPARDKPSIAVLPFANLSRNPDQEYFSDGIADDIITELSRSRALFVIARNSSFAYRERSFDVRQIAHELGVRYLLEGSVRRSAGRVRVTAQLIEAETGNHIWAERYDRNLSEIFAVQDEITSEVTTAIVPAVTDAEQRRALRKLPENLGAWEAYQRGLWHLGKCNGTDVVSAQHFFERAIALDAGFASAHAALSVAFAFHAGVSGVLCFDEGLRLAGEHARKAVEIDSNDPEGQAVLAWWRGTVGQGEQALHGLAATLAQSPNSAWAIGVNGVVLVMLGRRSEGRAALFAAKRLNPRDPSTGLFPGWITMSYYYEGDYARAVTMANTVIERYPNFTNIYRWLAAALGQLGRYDEARAALEHAITSNSFEYHVRSRPAWFLPEDHEHMLCGLRKAGWRAEWGLGGHL
jgi:adenylate cyclase